MQLQCSAAAPGPARRSSGPAQCPAAGATRVPFSAPCAQELTTLLRRSVPMEELWRVARGEIKYNDYMKQVGGKGEGVWVCAVSVCVHACGVYMCFWVWAWCVCGACGCGWRLVPCRFCVRFSSQYSSGCAPFLEWALHSKTPGRLRPCPATPSGGPPAARHRRGWLCQAGLHPARHPPGAGALAARQYHVAKSVIAKECNCRCCRWGRWPSSTRLAAAGSLP